MKNLFLMLFMYLFWFSVFGCIGWLFFSVKKWDKMQQKHQRDYQRSK